MAMEFVESHSAINPLDLLEEILSANEWPFDRSSNDELLVDCKGSMGSYQLHFSWSADLSAMHFSCFTDLKVGQARRGPIYELLAICNGRMWLGHFDLASGDDSPTFRHTVLLRGAHGASVEQLEDLVDIALAECERFYTAFHFVVWGGKDPSDAITASLLDTVGEA
ncbi:MAG TPA: YbjN domain-containing protein [Alphaproteobacteria bacterium]|nr:YbjN domain-containing protein [Alphaproteobacteria bacterium]